jgi:hypothetical protein
MGVPAAAWDDAYETLASPEKGEALAGVSALSLRTNLERVVRRPPDACLLGAMRECPDRRASVLVFVLCGPERIEGADDRFCGQ